MLGQEFAVDPGPVVEAVQVRFSGQRDQVMPAALIRGEEREVSIVLPGGGIAAVVVPGRAVGLYAQDRMEPGLLGLAVEVDSAVEVAVVGDGDRLLAQRSRALHQRGDLGEAVEEAEFRVQVQVGEHGGCPSLATRTAASVSAYAESPAGRPSAALGAGSSNWKAAWRTRTASRARSRATMAVMRMSLVVITWMLMPASARVRNMVAA